MSTVDQVEVEVRSRLLRAEIAPGTFVRQDELAADLGVSKIPVREALQRLSGLGLIRFESNRGARVPALTAAEAEEIFTLRQAIEPRLLEQAVPALTAVDLAAAEMALDQPSTSNTEANWRFHHALYRPSGWDRGVAIAEILHASVAPYVQLYFDELGGTHDSDDEHRALLAACRGADMSAARRVLDAHLAGAATSLVDFLERQNGSDD